MSIHVVLYSTSACHLCERAAALLSSMPELRRVQLEVIDIADDDALAARYGAAIPVLACAGHELAWPFNADDIMTLIDRARRSAPHSRP
jgi:glutaredoxin